MDILSDEIIILIIKNLNLKDLFNFMQLSKRFHNIVGDYSVWKNKNEICKQLNKIKYNIYVIANENTTYIKYINTYYTVKNNSLKIYNFNHIYDPNNALILNIIIPKIRKLIIKKSVLDSNFIEFIYIFNNIRELKIIRSKVDTLTKLNRNIEYVDFSYTLFGKYNINNSINGNYSHSNLYISEIKGLGFYATYGLRLTKK